MIEVDITDEMKAEAEIFEKMLMDRGLIKHGGVLREEQAAYNGKLGELAFQYILDQHERWYIPQPDAIPGQPDKGDYEVFISGEENKTVDVKTAAMSSYRYMLVPLAQDKYPIYVGVRLRLDDDVAEVWGIAKQGQLYPVEFKIKNNGMLLTELEPIESFIDRLE